MKKILTTLVACAAFSSQAALVTTNASDYFLNLANSSDTSQSSSNAWQIGSGSGTQFSLLGFQDPNAWGQAGLVGWFASGFHGGYINTTTNLIQYDSQIPAAPGQLIMHPANGAANTDAITLRYLVPETTSFDISSYFQAIDTVRNGNTAQANGTYIAIEAAGNLIGFENQIIGTTFFNPPQPNSFSFDQQGIDLNQGDFIDFIIGANGVFLDDSTLAEVSISFNSNTASGPGSNPIPNPSTLLFLGLPLFGLYYSTRKRV